MTALQNRYSASSSFCNLSDCFQNYYTFCRQDGGDCFPLAQSLRCYPLTFKMVRFCCSVKPSQLWWGLLHIRTINEIYRTIPCFAPSPLPPLSKGGGLTARHKPLYCCFLLVPRPPFLFTKPFCRQDGGIASPPSLRTTFLPPLVKGEVLSPKKFGRLPEGLPHLPYPFRFSDTSVNNPSFRTQPSQNRTIPFAFRVASSTAPLPAKIKSAPVFTGANSSSH